ncbi:hypothetical protein [Microbacterium foliorum]|uniref:hypothetical protein n=1 Tax=Microbacterium foliorum TaxID=104336 RepID=UPI00099FBE52|nr:hypothetical protein [Microbacterium foliorum]AQY01620.1 hypothetical protein B2G67_09170 [Microbacterium foliorum]
MGYILDGGPQDGEFSEELPLGYVAKHIVAGVVEGEGDSPTPRAEWLGVATEQEFRDMPRHELTMAYDIAKKVAADWNEPDLGRKAIAAHIERVSKMEMKRRGIFDDHKPR